MGRASKALKAFIENIPKDKLTGFPNQAPTTLYTDNDFRLDLQSARPLTGEVTKKDSKGKTVKVTEVVGRTYNLQIQANKQSKVTSIKGLAPNTVSGPVLVDLKNGSYSLNAEQVRAALVSEMLIKS